MQLQQSILLLAHANQHKYPQPLLHQRLVGYLLAQPQLQLLSIGHALTINSVLVLLERTLLGQLQSVQEKSS